MRILKSYIRTILVIISISILSLMNVGKVVPNDIHFFKHIDKLVHFCMYFGLSFVFLLENHAHKIHIKKRWIVLDTIAIGIIMEFLQLYLTSTRNGNIYDAIFNFLGVCFGTGLFLILKNKPIVYKLFLIKVDYNK
ncbi:VanZ family protein [Saccharicrinis aurantiacus]|uniref:VanZ family protein n=1 Tax=Saccharicrinis aurantiacus TaxID=1849719 RepID=UPI002491BAE0|nr:VanZ family protein [Saccharicrinis aurantiacus]